MHFYRDLVKHSSVYGLGQVLGRLASLLLLPFYTYYLRPADYGVIAILDLTAGVFRILIGSGMNAAVSRYYFDATTPRAKSQVWWTGLTFVAGFATVLIIPAWLLRGSLAHLMLGVTDSAGSRWYTLVLLTIWLNCLGQLVDQYLRVRKWSAASVGLSLVRLLLNIGLNVWFLAGLRLGLEGVLLGNLLTAGAMTLVLCALLFVHARPYAVDAELLHRLLAFGAPLVVTTLLALLMHQADRFLLRLFASMNEVGVYSLAYNIGQGVNTLCLIPFSAIWSVLIYEVASQPNAKRIYGAVFEYFVIAMSLVLLAASLFARPLLSLLTPDGYAPAADLVPVICLAYLFYSLHEHFRVPALLAKRTLSLVPAFVLGASVNLGANLLLIPRMGSAGAAWASVVTFAAFSFFGLYNYRRIDRFEYPFLKCAVLVMGMAGTYVACRALEPFWPQWSLLVACAAWCAWAAALGSIAASRYLRYSKEIHAEAVSSGGEEPVLAAAGVTE